MQIYFSLMQTWYKLQSRIISSLCSLSALNIESVWFITSMISFILDSIRGQISIFGFFIFSKTQFINSILFWRSRLYVDWSVSKSSHFFDSSISVCNVYSIVIRIKFSLWAFNITDPLKRGVLWIFCWSSNY
jgi:hypothetical protein